MGNHQSDSHQFGKLKILLETSVQKLDESGLFDSDVKTKWTTHPLQEGLFVRDDNQVQMIVNGNKRTHSQIKLATITCSDKLQIHNVTNENGLWFVIQVNYEFNDEKQYKIQTGDMIKFGRFRVKVIEINGHKMENQNSYESENLKCRFCFKETQEKVITPCNCKQGIYAQLHISCFKQWFQKCYSPFEFKDVKYYQWKKLECEHCKKQFTCKCLEKQLIDNFKVDEQDYSLIEMPKHPYLVLELVSRDSSQMKGLYIVTGEVKIGRQQGISVRLVDASVSREHGEFKIKNGEFYLNDLASKFGTMLYVTNSFEIKPKPGCLIFQASQTRIRVKIFEGGHEPLEMISRDKNKCDTGISQFSTFQEPPENEHLYTKKELDKS